MGTLAPYGFVSGDTQGWIPPALWRHADVYASKTECDADRAAHAQRDGERRRQANAAIRAAGAAGIAGLCPLCATPRRFVCRDHDAEVPDLREGLVCDGCGTNARVRAALAMLQALCPNRSAPIYITEQVSAAYAWLRRHRTAATGSEFPRSRWQHAMLTARLWKRGAFESVRSEDVTRLSFATSSRHVVASFDVLEHVPDDSTALREFARVTEPGGWLILTVPFTCEACGSERARMFPDGRIEHLLAAEYHGDPLGGGALCLRHYGWDLLDALRAAGYRHAAIAFPRWPEAGLFGNLATFVAQR